MAVMEVREKPRDEDLLPWLRHLIATSSVQLRAHGRHEANISVTNVMLDKLSDAADELEAARVRAMSMTMQTIVLAAELAIGDWAFKDDAAKDSVLTSLLKIAGVEVIRGE